MLVALADMIYVPISLSIVFYYLFDFYSGKEAGGFKHTYREWC